MLRELESLAYGIHEPTQQFLGTGPGAILYQLAQGSRFLELVVRGGRGLPYLVEGVEEDPAHGTQAVLVALGQPDKIVDEDIYAG